MAVWRCPHCATPQPESSRCWVCRRSTTICGTCRSYRRGVAGGLGMCGLDPRRTALTGTEIRACWVAAPPPPEPGARIAIAVGPGPRDHGAPARRTFVPVETVAGALGVAGTTDPATRGVAAIAPSAGPAGRVPGTWWLWGDPEPWPDL